MLTQHVSGHCLPTCFVAVAVAHFTFTCAELSCSNAGKHIAAVLSLPSAAEAGSNISRALGWWRCCCVSNSNMTSMRMRCAVPWQLAVTASGWALVKSRFVLIHHTTRTPAFRWYALKFTNVPSPSSWCCWLNLPCGRALSPLMPKML